MTTLRSYRRFRVTSQIGSIEVALHPNLLDDVARHPTIYNLDAEVKHAAWRKLWEAPETARILKKLCDEQGTFLVRDRFFANVNWEEI